MKKSFYIIIGIIMVIFIMFLHVKTVSAATLNNVSVQTNKEQVKPGEEINVTINFGKDLGAYTIDVAYDNAVFDFVKVDNGVENDDGTKVRVTYYDTSGGKTPKTSAVITFKAKGTITSTNPTDFAVTLEGLANADASEIYDDITTPIKKNILVEPDYVDYTLALQYTGTIKPILLKDMILSTESKMGRNYEHVKLVADVTKAPTNGKVELFATKTDGTEIELINEGWGDSTGYAIGGKNVNQELQLRAAFSEVGKYTIKFKLINLDSSDEVIAQKSFDITVSTANAEETTNPDNNTENGSTIDKNEGSGTEIGIPESNNSNITDEQLPETLPKTGNTQYFIIVLIILGLVIAYVTIIKKK